MLYQVNKLLFQQKVSRQFVRNVFRQKPTRILYPLESRTLIKVSGNDAPIFLQGLITNDMQHFEEGANSMYAMFLNNKGRVLYDTLIHKWEGNDSFLLECDKTVHNALQKHLKIYKLKRNVDITNMSENLRLFAFISSPEVDVDNKINPKGKVNFYKDPRLTNLGHRVVINASASPSIVDIVIQEKTVTAEDETGYKYLRYKLGVSEGADDLPPGTCFPLEANCDYLHGVSFHKGCYIGQELTARVHHTGVVRKRIVPLKFKDIIEEEIEKDSPILTDDDKKSNIGKFKTWANDYGLGLVRIKEALEAKALIIGKHSLEVVRPSWWPIEAPKEKAAAKLE
ncbi:iron-sulfur cluster assembly factor IBA57, mitochondrial [Anticarsia gemmatalis]|uniref:iron-sulfur cluster assembly factor IBA57, mitochondrial n=1 Tax=Anticarsia gemmatalis TaxID=129554 RepID=UPI003F7735BB